MFAKFVIVAAAVAVAGPAFAITNVVGNDTGAPDGGVPAGLTTVVTFDGPNAVGVTNTTTGAVYEGSASVGGQYAAPALTAPGTNYQAVQTGGSSTFDFTGFKASSMLPLSRFSLYWGSVDTYNTLQFLSGATVISSFTGADFLPAGGNQVDPITNRRITFGFDKADNITGVRFLSSQNAFEYDTFGAAVPEPASWAMLIAGFGLVGATMRRRRTAMTSVMA